MNTVAVEVGIGDEGIGTQGRILESRTDLSIEIIKKDATISFESQR